MAVNLVGFRLFVEKDEPENYVGAMGRELSIDPNAIPEFIESGPIEIPEENIIYNQAIWQVLKPIEPDDKFVRIKFCKCTSPNLNQHAYTKGEDGKIVPYNGDVRNRIHLVTMDKFSELLSRGWQAALGGAAGGGLF